MGQNARLTTEKKWISRKVTLKKGGRVGSHSKKSGGSQRSKGGEREIKGFSSKATGDITAAQDNGENFVKRLFLDGLRAKAHTRAGYLGRGDPKENHLVRVERVRKRHQINYAPVKENVNTSTQGRIRCASY